MKFKFRNLLSIIIIVPGVFVISINNKASNDKQYLSPETKNFILNNKDKLFEKIESIGKDYFVNNLDYFVNLFHYRKNQIYKLHRSEDYYLVNKSLIEENGEGEFRITTNNKDFEPENLTLTFDYENEEDFTSGEDINATIEDYEEIDSEDIFPNNIIQEDDLITYKYNINDLKLNGTDYSDFKFYLEDNLIYSSKNKLNMHLLSPYENTMNIYKWSIEIVDNQYPESIIELKSTNNVSDRQAEALRVETGNKGNISLDFVESYGDDILRYKIYNLAPGNYTDWTMSPTRYFKYNYLSQNFYPIWDNSNNNRKEWGSADISYGRKIDDKIYIEDIYHFSIDKEEGKITLYVNLLWENKCLKEAPEKIKVFFNKKNDYFNEASEGSLEFQLEKKWWQHCYKYVAYYEKDKISGNIFYNFEVYSKKNWQTEYSDQIQYKWNKKIYYSFEGEKININDVQLVEKYDTSIRFNVTFEKDNDFFAENIAVGYKKDGEDFYSNQEKNLELEDSIINETENEITFQYILRDLEEGYNYSDFKLFVPSYTKAHLLNVDENFTFIYDRNNPDYQIDDFQMYTPQNEKRPLFYLFLSMIIIFLIIVFIISLIIFNNWNEKRKIEKKQEEFE